MVAKVAARLAAAAAEAGGLKDPVAALSALRGSAARCAAAAEGCVEDPMAELSVLSERDACPGGAATWQQITSALNLPAHALTQQDAYLLQQSFVEPAAPQGARQQQLLLLPPPPARVLLDGLIAEMFGGGASSFVANADAPAAGDAAHRRRLRALCAAARAVALNGLQEAQLSAALGRLRAPLFCARDRAALLAAAAARGLPRDAPLSAAAAPALAAALGDFNVTPRGAELLWLKFNPAAAAAAAAAGGGGGGSGGAALALSEWLDVVREFMRARARGEALGFSAVLDAPRQGW
ncbi:hypothetical protein JKP88DRAFT_274894 [Tribonema minus]|uniref:Uncharacterized protein n=1 Tax=Tribonema minus TaxID=303371 RepID=A0A835ZF64_9STRA|nr:hypothetical protein JKP88DRAFT_274894 [Tribonema minus]